MIQPTVMNWLPPGAPWVAYVPWQAYQFCTAQEDIHWKQGCVEKEYASFAFHSINRGCIAGFWPQLIVIIIPFLEGFVNLLGERS